MKLTGMTMLVVLAVAVACGKQVAPVAGPASHSSAATPTSSASTAASSSPIPADWETRDDPQGRFSISLPPGWKDLPAGKNVPISVVDSASGLGVTISVTDAAEPSAAGATKLAASEFKSTPAHFRTPKIIDLPAGPAAVSLGEPMKIGHLTLHVLKYYIPGTRVSCVVSFIGGSSADPNDIPAIINTFRFS